MTGPEYREQDEDEEDVASAEHQGTPDANSDDWGDASNSEDRPSSDQARETDDQPDHGEDGSLPEGSAEDWSDESETPERSDGAPQPADAGGRRDDQGQDLASKTAGSDWEESAGADDAESTADDVRDKEDGGNGSPEDVKTDLSTADRDFEAEETAEPSDDTRQAGAELRTEDAENAPESPGDARKPPDAESEVPPERDVLSGRETEADDDALAGEGQDTPTDTAPESVDGGDADDQRELSREPGKEDLPVAPDSQDDLKERDGGTDISPDRPNDQISNEHDGSREAERALDTEAVEEDDDEAEPESRQSLPHEHEETDNVAEASERQEDNPDGEEVAPLRDLPREYEEDLDFEIAEINDAAEHLPIDHVDFNGFDPELAREVHEDLSTLTSRYPEVDAVRWVSTTQERNKALAERGIDLDDLPSDVYAVAAGDVFGEQAGITYNEIWAADPEQLQESLSDDVQAGWHPPGTDQPSALLTHEFGHMIDFHLEDAGLRGNDLEPALDEMTARGYDWVKDNVSEYAASRADLETVKREIVAECFAEYIHSNNPRPAARTIGSAIEAAFTKLRSA